jgi:beta-mannosidase
LILSNNQKRGTNITFSFESAFHYGRNVSARPDAETFPGKNGDVLRFLFQVANNLADTILQFVFPGVRYWMRKMPCDFGWDWVRSYFHPQYISYSRRWLAMKGPAFAPSGIYKQAFLITLHSPPNSALEMDAKQAVFASSASIPPTDMLFVEEASLDIYKVGQSSTTPPNETADWLVNVSLSVRSASTFWNPKIAIALPELGLISEAVFLPSIVKNATSPTWLQLTWAIPDSAVERWYPHNLGRPRLYNITISLDLCPTSERCAPLVLTIPTGFRTIQLVQNSYSNKDVRERGITPGDQWHFKVNGKDTYIMGSNLVPFDPFYSRITDDQVRWILESAVKSGQNMVHSLRSLSTYTENEVQVRVWGGGIYQPSNSDVSGGGYNFYSVCDELGILVWSELIFSDALQPINDFLLKTIEPEVRQNVRRINRHPSNAQWAGGNEIEGIALWTDRWIPNGKHYLNEVGCFTSQSQTRF